MTAENKLKELNISLPPVQQPVACYVPYVKAGDLIYVSGQGPVKNGEIFFKGKLGREVSLEEGYEASKMAALNILAVLREAAGSLDNIEKIISLHGYVNSTDEFCQQPNIIDGASELLMQVFGEKGLHARCAFSSNSLPMNTCVEIEAIAMVKELKGETV